MFPGVGNLHSQRKVFQRLSTELSVPVAHLFVPPVALAATHILFFAPLGVELSTLLQYVFLSWAVEWKCHTIAQADLFIAPASLFDRRRGRVHPCALIPLQPHPLKHG